MPTKVHISIPTLTDIKSDTVASLLAWSQKTHLEYTFGIQKNTYIHAARNKAIWEAANQGATHLMFIDSDIDFPADGIEKLLARNVDIVGGLYFGRIEPFPVAKVRHKKLNGLANLDYIPKTGLHKVMAVGTGFMLIDMKVFKAMQPPFFFHTEPTTFGLDSVAFPHNELGEDVAFCLKAQEHGFKIWLDADISLTHIGEGKSDRASATTWLTQVKGGQKDPYEQCSAQDTDHTPQ